jgi:hypothetical protein
MKLATVAKRALVLFPLAVITAGLAVPTAAGAASPGPIQFRLVNPGPIQCPTGTFVAVNPGPPQNPSFVLVGPGPIQCPAGVDALVHPGPPFAPQGGAVALPLTAVSCQEGTALFDTELSLLGASAPGPSPIGAGPAPGTGPCPGGDAAFAALESALANVPVAPPGSFGLISPGPIQNPGGLVLVSPGPIQAPGILLAYTYDSAGTPRGVLVEKDPGPAQAPGIFVLVPSGTPGVSVLRDPGPVQ